MKTTIALNSIMGVTKSYKKQCLLHKTYIGISHEHVALLTAFHIITCLSRKVKKTSPQTSEQSTGDKQTNIEGQEDVRNTDHK
jgi:hypothetical protein